jgi:hypothetical protein
VEAEGSVRGMRWCFCYRLVRQRINGGEDGGPPN